MCLFKNVDGFGVATCDVSTGEFVVTSFEDTAENKVMDEIAKYMPSEIICNDGIDFGDQIERVLVLKQLHIMIGLLIIKMQIFACVITLKH